MNALADVATRVQSLVTGRGGTADPLVDKLVRKSLAYGGLLSLLVAVWLLLVNLVAGQVILRATSAGPGTDLVLQQAARSIDEVAEFAASTEPIMETITPQEAYPAAIDVAPLETARNPFAPWPLPGPAPAPDLGELIRQEQAPKPEQTPEPAPEPEQTPTVRGIVGRADGSYLAVLEANHTSRAVRPGDTFMDWQVLAVQRESVELRKDGKTRTITWEGNK
jgi:hypothetical protein